MSGSVDTMYKRACLLHQNIELKGMNKRQKAQHDLEQKVIDKILSRLGKPHNLHSVTARNVFDNKWRVNIWTEELSGVHSVAKKYTIIHSFFCELTEGGTLRTKPKIEKRLYRRIPNRPSD